MTADGKAMPLAGRLRIRRVCTKGVPLAQNIFDFLELQLPNTKWIE